MGVAVYICSTSHFSGKTAICVGLVRRLLKDSFQIGYMKPLSVAPQPAGTPPLDEDAMLMANLLGKEPNVQLMTPVCLTTQGIVEVLQTSGYEAAHFEKLQNAYEQVSRQSDVVLLEGGGNLREGTILNLAPASVTKALQASALVVVKYVTDLQVVDDVLMAQSILGEFMLGVVLNVIPPDKTQFIQEIIVPILQSRDVRVLAVVPREHLLRAITVREMVEVLEGEVLCAAENQEDLVENLMIGAMNVDAALSHFRTKPNKAVFTGGDRLDIQLAALETSTRCLVLTGGFQPSSITLSRAEEIGVPVISVTQDTLTAIESIEHCFGKTRFHHRQKVDVLDRLMDDHFDFDRLYLSLGLR